MKTILIITLLVGVVVQSAYGLRQKVVNPTLIQEVSFDPAVDDVKSNKTAIEEAVSNTTQKNKTEDGEDDKTQEDIADESSSTDNDINACLVEMGDYIFNFESLSK